MILPFALSVGRYRSGLAATAATARSVPCLCSTESHQRRRGPDRIERVGRFVDLIGLETGQIPFAALRAAESTGRPLGSDDFVVTILSPSWSGSLAVACGGGVISFCYFCFMSWLLAS